MRIASNERSDDDVNASEMIPPAQAASAPTGGTRKRLEHIDAMRPVKQAAVISTHALVFFAPLATSSTVVGLIMLTRFSRDAFLFVSACMLTYSYKDAARLNLTHYFKRRFVSVGLPYAAWTVIYYIYTLATPTSTFPYYSLRVGEIFSASGAHYFVHLLTTGYYHLYYLLVIMEFYVLFPLLLLFVRRFAKWHVHLMLAAVLWQVLYGVLVSSHYFGFHLSGFMQTRLIFSYPVYLVGGVITALHLDDFHAWACRYARLIVALTFTSALLGELFVYLARYTGVPVFLRTGSYVFSPMIVPYNVGAILCVYLLGVFLVSPSRSWRTRSAVSSGSDNSYGVYLSQMLWIPLLVRVRAHLGVQIPWEVAAPLALVTVYSMGYVFTGLFARTPLAKAVSGRGQASWGSLLVWRHKPPRRDDTGEGPLNVALE